MGAGWWEREHAGFGLPFPPAGERLDQLELTIETLRALWAPGTKAYQGKRVALPETTCYPRPTGHIPIVVGGSGDRALARPDRPGRGVAAGSASERVRLIALTSHVPQIHAGAP